VLAAPLLFVNNARAHYLEIKTSGDKNSHHAGKLLFYTART
jgi:hypothetical protein